MRHPAALPALALAAGICAGVFSPFAVPLIYPKAVLVSCIFAATVAFARRHEHAVLVFLVSGFVAAGCVLGISADSAAQRTPLGAYFHTHASPDGQQLFALIDGRLRADALRGPSGVTLSIDVDRVEMDGAGHVTRGGVIVGVGGEPEGDQILQWRSGRRIRMPATLRRPARYLNAGVPDSHRQYAWRGTTLVGSVKSARLVEILAPADRWSEAGASIRAAVRAAVAASVLPWGEQSAAVVSAILIGDRAGLDEDVERRLQEAGTYHVIAISGGNIAVLAGLWVVVLRAIRAGPRWSALVLIAMLTAYAAVVEGGASVGRATLMAAIYFGARLWDQQSLPANIAALCAVVLLCLQPLQVADAGFVLTFGATLGILVGLSGVPWLFGLERFATMPAWLPLPAGLLWASICAEVALLPVSALAFSRVTAAGLVVNFAAIPLMTVVQIAGMAAVALTHAGLQAAGLWSGWIAHWAVQGLVGSAALVEVLPWLVRRIPPPALWIVAAYYVSLGFAVRTRRALYAAITVVCGAWIVAAPSPERGDGARLLRVTFLDVGQGDATLVQFPNGRTLTIDAGGLPSTTFDIGGRVVSPALWASGVRRLDYMNLSHSDADHIGGAASLFRDFRPGEVWEGVPVPPNTPTNELRALAESAGTVWRTLIPFDRARFGDVELRVHHPPLPDWERQRVRNDDSVVMEIRHGGVSFVLTGDIGRDVERQIAPGFERAPIRILKVPHHGSATSSSREFLSTLHPDIAVISCGRGNPFGHPVPAVVQRYRDTGTAIYRTDQDGAVTIETDGQTVRVRTFTNRILTLRTR